MFLLLYVSTVIISWQICIAMKVYEESVGDRLARLKGGKLQLSVVLRLCSWGHISSYQSYNVDFKEKEI